MMHGLWMDYARVMQFCTDDACIMHGFCIHFAKDSIGFLKESIDFLKESIDFFKESLSAGAAVDVAAAPRIPASSRGPFSES